MTLQRVHRRTLAATAALGIGTAALGGLATSASAATTLNGSGSTFQLSFQQSAIEKFHDVNSGVTVNYGGGGSGKGRTDLASGVVQFAGSDSPIASDEQSSFKGKTILYFPVVIGPITVSYNLSGVSKPLQLAPGTVAKIFEGKIKTWNDPAISQNNPETKLPNTPIVVARRSDSSGTTQNFSQFLEEAAPNSWTLGSSSTIDWPATSRGGNGNGGVAQIIKSTNGAIGYVDYADARSAGLKFAKIKNRAGKFVMPSPKTATAAANRAKVANNLTFSAIWAPGQRAYPITYQSWVLVNAKQSNAGAASALKSYVGYLVGRGQKLLGGLGYAPLPDRIDMKAMAQLNKITS